jgi:glycosyltransferase involved in cell wall biosynthesis
MKALVVVPTFKNPQYLDEALESVAGQTRPADELVIVHTNGDLVNYLNVSIERSDCDAFVILADDDKLDPMFLEKTVREMEKRDVDIVYTDCHIFGDRNQLGGALGKWTQENIDRDTVPLCTSLCRKSAWDKAGRYVSVPYYDWDFWWRCFYSGATAHWLKEPLFWWRDHGKSGTRTENHVESRRFILNRHNKLREQMGITA